MADKITTEMVDRLATLARLEFNSREKEEVIADLNKMLDFVGKLNEVNTDGLEPLIYMNEATNVLREDEASVDITQQQALSNAPKKDSDYFKVPKVVEGK